MGKPGFFTRLGGSAERRGKPSGTSTRSGLDANARLALLDQFEELSLGWFWATDASGKVTYLSESAAEMIGLEPGQIMGTALSELFIPDAADDPDKAERPLGFLLTTRNSFTELQVRLALAADAPKPARRRGSEPSSDNDDDEAPHRWWSITGKPSFDREGEFLGYRGSAKDITATRERERDASRLAQYDVLTGLANRHRMEKRLSTTLTAYRAAKRSCALLMMDLDRFKQVNDTLGHPAGDELLKQVAQRIEQIVGEKGEIGRLGGDEFQIILPDIDDRGDLGDLSQRLIQMISQPYSINGDRAIIGTSIGIAIAPYDGVSADELVSSADLALYAAKGGGRGQFRFYTGELKDGARQRKKIEEDLRDAFHHKALEMHYQPLIDAKTDMVRGFEALMRWNHEERGWIGPAVFIPIAEETGIINDLGDWALKQSCRDAVAWGHNLRVSVNVSAVQFANEDFPAVVKQALVSSGLDPGLLELEITESVFMADPHATKRMFARLKKLGVRLALDDFGTGYSSLSYLSRAPFDKIKIDQSFVRGATHADNNNAAIITAIVSLAAALKMETVAEGVEARDELELVREHGAGLIQGWVFAKAMPQDEIVDRLERRELKFEVIGPDKHRAERKSLFRKIGVIHEDHRYDAFLRNLSRSGAMIEGILNVPEGTELVIDLGDGQLVVSRVRRSDEATQGLEFEQALVSDGADGLCTRHRVSPYALAAAGMPLAALPSGSYTLLDNHEKPKTRAKFLEVSTQPGLAYRE